MDEGEQLLNFSLEGMKFIFGATKDAIEMMLKLAMVLKISKMQKGMIALEGAKLVGGAMGKGFRALKYGKNAGQTNRDNFQLKSGGTATCYAVDKKIFKSFQKYTKKTGVLFYKLADFSKAPGGKVHIMFPRDSLEKLKLAQALAEAEYAKKNGKNGGKEGMQAMREVPIGKAVKDLGYSDLLLDEMVQKCMDKLETKSLKEEFKSFVDDMKGGLFKSAHNDEIKEAVKDDEGKGNAKQTDMDHKKVSKVTREVNSRGSKPQPVNSSGHGKEKVSATTKTKQGKTTQQPARRR